MTADDRAAPCPACGGSPVTRPHDGWLLCLDLRCPIGALSPELWNRFSSCGAALDAAEGTITNKEAALEAYRMENEQLQAERDSLLGAILRWYQARQAYGLNYLLPTPQTRQAAVAAMKDAERALVELGSALGGDHNAE